MPLKEGYRRIAIEDIPQWLVKNREPQLRMLCGALVDAYIASQPFEDAGAAPNANAEIGAPAEIYMKSTPEAHDEVA